MRFFTRLFGNSDHPQGPEITFGRYTDLHKPEHKNAARKRARELFAEGRYQESFSQFFEYLTDDEEDNIHTYTDDTGLHFELLQGSKLIRGTIGHEMINAEARVARAHSLPIGFMRRMLELNHMLKYGRYALDDDDHLTILFDSYLLDGSPTKSYHALKEIAVSADKQDDLLIAEFAGLESVNTGHVRPLPQREKEIKTGLLKSRVTDVLRLIDTMTQNQGKDQEGVIYVLLDLAYRLDYLVSPEGRIKEIFERVHLILFGADDRSAAEKIVLARKALEEIMEMSDDQIYAELYKVTCSFGITARGTHEQFAGSVEGTLGSMDWFLENQQSDIALAIPGFIAGYGLFNYAYPPPLHELLHLYYYIVEPKFFMDLGFSPMLYDVTEGRLDKRGIRAAIRAIEDQYRPGYPRFRVDTRHLEFSDLIMFVKSYFTVLMSLDLTKKS